MKRSALACALGSAALVIGTSAVTPLAGAAATPLAAVALDGTVKVVTLVGSLQSELGCSADWQPDCAATRLAQAGGGTTYSKTFDVPAGSYEYKVAIGGTWDESYGAGGAKGGANLPLRLAGPAKVTVSYDDATHLIGVTPLTLKGPADTADGALAKDSLRAAVTTERFYFLMADRFANGSAANDAGGLTGGPLVTGLDPTHKGFYHGGDLKGVVDKLDYIKGLGTTAIWLTPSFKNKPVQGLPGQETAGYHGYWVTDFTQIDPHLGTNEDMKALIDAAHAKGMKVFFDIITNHTADVIDYADGTYDYVPKATAPYKDASGKVFDDAAYAGKDTFPAVDPKITFPYTPIFRTEADKTAKTPAWLNDPTMYHNRGNSTWAGESVTYGDFVGLDDLWTERPEVVAGMTDIYSTWANSGIDGFRIDTMKHVNMEFWQKFAPAVLQAGRAAGRPDFFMFGEVYDADPAFDSQYTTTGKVQATLDFGFQAAALNFVQGKPTTGLRDFFAGDDWYTDADSNAYELPTFLGNHDMGRVGMMLSKAGYTGADLLARDQLAHALMYLTRGNPVVYYGDEQGFTGLGGDQDAREDMFATKVAQYAAEPLVGGGSMGTGEHYGTTGTLYRYLAQLAALRTDHPALADGAQVHRYASNAAGIYAFSRMRAQDGIEYLVVANNATTAQAATFATYSPTMTFTPVLGAADKVTSGKDARVTVTVPPLSVQVFRASGAVATPTAPPAVFLTSPGAGGVVGGRAPIEASVPANEFTQVSFAYRPVGTAEWTYLGTDDNAPYRVVHDTSGIPAGTLLEYRAIAKDRHGNLAATSSYGIVGTPSPTPGTPGGPTGPVGPVTQPTAVSVPGTHNTEMGCAADWSPDCAQAQLALDPKDQIWKKTYDALPAAQYAYKAAINSSWDENYGAGGAGNGANIGYTAPGGKVSFYYDHATHYVASDAQGPIITAPGSFQAKLGCGGDWAPDCMRPWLQDPDGDGVYTWATSAVPAGSYEVKVAHGLSWAENYGAGGAKDGANVAFTVPGDGAVVTFSYVLATHVLTVTTGPATGPGAAAISDLAKGKAVWVEPGLLAWPKDAVPAGMELARLRWRLYAAPAGGLTVDAEALTAPGATAYDLTYDPTGLPSDVVAAHPELKNYLLLRVPGAAAKPSVAGTLLQGQVAVAMADELGRVRDATGVQIAYVLDALYAGRAVRSTYGVTWARGVPSFRLWAPTAQSVTLLTWPAGTATQAPASAAAGDVAAATRTAMTRGADGSWTVQGTDALRGARYLYEVKVFAPTTGKVETNLVTDPYSVALTVDSSRSVLVDLSDPALAPAQWASAAAPSIGAGVNQAIYELHIRDFSVGDAGVPAEHRGSYLAFADDGAGRGHLRDLAKAGLNTVHLLPSFDIATIEEDKANQATPRCDLPAFPPDSPEQQKCVKAVATKDAFNWGYDPLHFMAPEGSYASTTAAADGGTRVAQFRTMVGGLHADGLRVVLDQVYNHTTAAGQSPLSVLDRVVPGYYHRLDANGAVATSTCCTNTASEHAMMTKLMVDSVVLWARQYKVDGFRFDLMGHHSVATMKAIRAALDALTVRRDGVDGTAITLYGEGWNFGEVADNARFVQATQGQLGGTGIATFNDRLRDAVRGGGPFDDDPRKQGFGSGAATDPNGAAVNGDATKQAASLAHDTDLLQLGLAGNLRAFSFTSQVTGKPVTGAGIDYNGKPAGYAEQPGEVVNYVDAHDNETLFDALTYKLPAATAMADRVRMNTLSLATVTLSQGISFWHAGADLLRGKSLDRNSYDSGDWFNALDFSGQDNGFARGLPPEADNGAKWGYARPLLANPALKPGPADIASASAAARELLRLRASTPLFRLGSAEAIAAKVSFPASGGPSAIPGVVAMRLDDTRSTPVDGKLAGVVVVFNATPKPVRQTVPGMAGAALTLSPVQATGADPVVRTASWDQAAGVASVPARTVAVFVQPRA